MLVLGAFFHYAFSTPDLCNAAYLATFAPVSDLNGTTVRVQEEMVSMVIIDTCLLAAFAGINRKRSPPLFPLVRAGLSVATAYLLYSRVNSARAR